MHPTDYDETYAPVFKYSSVRLLLAIVATDDLELHQMDVFIAFRHGDLDTDIYMLPTDLLLLSAHLHFVYMLHKALGGLMNAPILYHGNIDSFLSHYGFRSTPNDPG